MTDMAADEARVVIKRVQRSLDDLSADVLALHDGRAWLALGHASWDELVATDLRPHLALTKADREVVMVQLTAGGMSSRDVAAVVEVSRDTVQRRSGRNLPAAPRRSVRKATPEESGRRDGLIVQHYRAGHSSREIADAIGVGVSTVCNRLRALKEINDKRRVGRGPINEPGLWRDGDMPAPSLAPRWERSVVVDMIKMLDDQFTESTFANVLANQVNEALAAGDQAWLAVTVTLTARAQEKLERVQRILTDARYRTACTDTHEGDEQLRRPRPLRAVR